MRNILLAASLATLVALTNIPVASAGTGIGTGVHTAVPNGPLEACTSDARWVLSAEAGVGGAIAGDSICVFQPDFYTSDQCYLIAGGSECSYGTDNGVSRLTVWDSGDFDYQYDWADGTETVVGSLVI